jgi:hypothetical protein
MQSLNFVIWAPEIYTPYGGGCIALHKLCHNINTLGEKCYIWTDSTNPDWIEYMVTMDEAIELCKDGKGIAIYPEVCAGNPFNSDKVMRWILYYVRESNQNGIFGANDLIYKFAPIYTLRYQQTVHGELRALELFLNIFYDKGLQRSGTCYIVKKGRGAREVHPRESVCLDDFKQKGGNEYLAHHFQTRETFYTYDNATWFSIFAALCGCKSIVIPDGKHTPEEWYAKFPYFKYGIAYGETEKELKHAADTLPLLKQNLLNLEAQTIVQTKDFIKKAYTL